MVATGAACCDANKGEMIVRRKGDVTHFNEANDQVSESVTATETVAGQQRTELVLFGTYGCHLCEQAEWLLQPLRDSGRWQLKVVDIADHADSDALIARYGLRLPVLLFGTHELDWPFDLVQVEQWLASRQAHGSP